MKSSVKRGLPITDYRKLPHNSSFIIVTRYLKKLVSYFQLL